MIKCISKQFDAHAGPENAPARALVADTSPLEDGLPADARTLSRMAPVLSQRREQYIQRVDALEDAVHGLLRYPPFHQSVESFLAASGYPRDPVCERDARFLDPLYPRKVEVFFEDSVLGARYPDGYRLDHKGAFTVLVICDYPGSVRVQSSKREDGRVHDMVVCSPMQKTWDGGIIDLHSTTIGRVFVPARSADAAGGGCLCYKVRGRRGCPRRVMGPVVRARAEWCSGVQSLHSPAWCCCWTTVWVLGCVP